MSNKLNEKFGIDTGEFQQTSPEILKQPNVDEKISIIAELRKKLHERLEAEKGKKVERSEEKLYHNID